MVLNHCHLQPGCQIIEETEPCAPHWKYVLEEALLPVAGPEVEIIHIKPFDLDPPIDPDSDSKEQPHKNHMILPLIFLFHSGEPNTVPDMFLCIQVLFLLLDICDGDCYSSR